jgi:hypothetical protein
MKSICDRDNVQIYYSNSNQILQVHFWKLDVHGWVRYAGSNLRYSNILLFYLIDLDPGQRTQNL